MFWREKEGTRYWYCLETPQKDGKVSWRNKDLPQGKKGFNLTDKILQWSLSAWGWDFRDPSHEGPISFALSKMAL